MTVADLVYTHGYWVLALGGLVDGESVILLAGLAASHGLMALPLVVLIAAATGFASDQILFWLGRWRGERLLARWPWLQRQVGRGHRWIERRPAGAIIGVRFAYGLRTVGPILIGMSRVSALRFTLLNAAGALLWASVFTAIGWFSGKGLQRVLDEAGRLEGLLLLALAAGALAALVLWRWRGNQRQ